MPNYKILLYKKKSDYEGNIVFKKIDFNGKYIDALRKGRVLMDQDKCKAFDVPMNSSTNYYKEFIEKFLLLTKENKAIVANTLSNIFTMRLIGNKTHGDLAEVGIAEFVNRYMRDYECEHVGKDLYRAKSHEEDIVVTDKVKDVEIPISLKAYGDGPLQLSTDKESHLWSLLLTKGDHIDSREDINSVLSSAPIREIFCINVMPLIYREKTMECNILIFDAERALNDVDRIVKVTESEGKGRKHPIYKFLNEAGEYICEVRYGGAAANALQRGLWTHTRNAEQYFTSATDGWINYIHNKDAIDLIRLALNSSAKAHKKANSILVDDIMEMKKNVKK